LAEPPVKHFPAIAVKDAQKIIKRVLYLDVREIYVLLLMDGLGLVKTPLRLPGQFRPLFV
jgi:hypothetical protein